MTRSSATPRPVSEPRIALLTNFIPPYRIPLFRELARRSSAFRVMISIAMEADRSWPAEFGGLNVTVQRSFAIRSVRDHPSGFRETAYVHFPYDTIPELARFRPDIVISDQFGFRTMNALIYRLLFRRRLIVWATISEATEAGRSPVRLALRRLIVRFADAFITSGGSGSRYLARFKAAPEKLFAVPQTVDVTAFASVPLARDSVSAFRLLYVGRLIALKQVAPFTRILSQWCADHAGRDIEFWIAGDGPEGRTIANLSVAANLHLRLLGDVPYHHLPGVYGQAGVLVLPTLADEWGLVVNEAMAAGVPVFGSVYSHAVQELVDDGRTGWTFRIDHELEVRNALDRMLETTESDLEQMRHAARKTAVSITPQAVADRMMEAVRFALRPRG